MEKRNNKRIKSIIQRFLEQKSTINEQAKIETWYLLKTQESLEVDTELDYDHLKDKLWAKINEQLIIQKQPVKRKKSAKP